MSVTSALLTYGDVSRKEDVVLNAIEILTAQENQFMNSVSKSKAIDTVHSFLVDSLDTPGTLAVQMGADFSASSLTTPTRLTNIVEEIAKAFIVARPQEVVQHYWGQDETVRQLNKAMKDWGNAAEFDLIRSTLVSGVSGTVAKMNGAIAAISKSTNTTAHNSGTVFSATILDALMQNCWTNSNGDVATDLYVGGITRRIIDGFTQKTNVVVNTPAVSDIVKTVQTYETAFGKLNIRKHRYVDISGTDATGRVLGTRPDKFRIAYLDMPFVKDLAENGPYTKKAVYGSCTLEVRNQDSNFFASGFLRSV